MYRTAVQEKFPETLKVSTQKDSLSLQKSRIKLRYGTNPHQKAAMYVLADSLWGTIRELKRGKQGLSQTNICDVDRALRILGYFIQPSCAVMKHLIPSGFASTRKDEELRDVFIRARDCDALAAFGGVAVFNSVVDANTADELMKGFFEVVCAPGYEKEALTKFNVKKDLRILQYDPTLLQKEGRFRGDHLGLQNTEFSSLSGGGFIVADPFLTQVNKNNVLTVTEKTPSERAIKDLIFSWYVLIGVRSNGIVVSKDYGTLGIGSGQQDRVGAVKLALEKAVQRGHNEELRGAVLASDGFFPFKDSIELAAHSGISAIVQPGGSRRDKEVIESCNNFGIAMVFTKERAFSHF